MRELLPDLDRWVLERGEPAALATVVRVFRAAPRPEGAKLAISARGELSGSVSGGCVEAGVVEGAQLVLATGRPALLHFGIADDVAWDAGLSCGGAIEVFVERLDAAFYRRLRQPILDGVGAVVATVVGEGGALPLGAKLLLAERSMDSEAWAVAYGEIGKQVIEDARALLRLGHAGQSELHAYPRNGSAGGGSTRHREVTTQAFLDTLPRPPHLVIFGAVHIAIPLVRIAHEVGFRTTVVDARSAFATPERLGHAGALVRAWPQDAVQAGGLQIDESTYVAVLTHDPKLDEPAICLALAAGARYVGAIGSQRTQASRAARLRTAGLSEEQVRRIRGPIGLDIGARTPDEIALAIMGEVVAAARGALKTE
jgi:xanthine dehydrogenase accessory factor